MGSKLYDSIVNPLWTAYISKKPTRINQGQTTLTQYSKSRKHCEKRSKQRLDQALLIVISGTLFVHNLTFCRCLKNRSIWKAAFNARRTRRVPSTIQAGQIFQQPFSILFLTVLYQTLTGMTMKGQKLVTKNCKGNSICKWF